ncbi:hypothetical protein DDT56_03435 [Brenneria corticis]|uniref:Uncharacterized protein n=1 Tax=Brenneria corticis TaxID=2173106 RepID=A0A2U1UBK7_9GAMM|nr:hypothetical protein DDT56_03435 [Brenneria sp. CFCC 11842]
MRDTVARVSSDSIAKLHGFIVSTLKDGYRQGKIPQATLRLPALFFLFMQRHHHGELSFSYQERAIDTLDVQRIFSADDPPAAFADQPVLFGSVRRQTAFTEHLRAAVDEVQTRIHTSPEGKIR